MLLSCVHVGCLLKKDWQKGDRTQVPQDPPSYTPEEVTHTLLIKKQTTGEKINAYSQVIAWNKQLIEYKAVYVPKIHV